MAEEDTSHKANKNVDFMNGPDVRGLRILLEQIEPNTRLDQHDVSDTIMFLAPPPCCRVMLLNSIWKR